MCLSYPDPLRLLFCITLETIVTLTLRFIFLHTLAVYMHHTAPPEVPPNWNVPFTRSWLIQVRILHTESS